MSSKSSDNAMFSLKSIARTTPGSSIAMIGLAISMFSYESNRMSSFQTVEKGSLMSSLPAISALLVFVFFAMIIYRVRPSFRIHRSALFGFLIAGAYAIAALVLSGQAFGPIGSSFEFIVRFILRLSELLLLVCWAESLIPLGAKRVALLFASSLIVLGLINVLSSLIRIETAYIFVAAFPFISMTCLYWFKDHNASFKELYSTEVPAAFSAFKLDQSLMPQFSSALTKASLGLVFLLPLLCFSFIFGHIHFTWVPVQDGSFISFSVQLAAAAGTAIAGVLLLMLIAFFWGRRRLQMYFLLTLPIVFLALYISSFVDGQNAFLYVVPLNIAQKITFFFIWLTPFLIPSKKSPMFTWCMALALYQLGKSLSTIASGIPDDLFYTMCVIVFISVLIIGLATGIILDKEREGKGIQGNSINVAFEKQIRSPLYDEPSKSRDASTSSLNDQQEISIKCNSLAREYQLTRREEEVLLLLAEGMNAGSVAEVLVVSTSTAKSHMRNIYAKLSIHTHNELLLLIHKKIYE